MKDTSSTGPLNGPKCEPQAAVEPAADDGARSAEAKPLPVASAPDVVAESMSSGLPRVLEITGMIIAPTTLLSALMFYFGWLHAYWFCYYFGVNSTMLDFTIQDYLMRSVDGFFVPLTVVAAITLLTLWAHWLLKPRLVIEPDTHATHWPVLRSVTLPVIVAVVTVTAGFALLLIGMANVLGWKVLNHAYVPALSLTLGVLLLVYGARLHRRIRSSSGDPTARTSASASMAVAEWAAAFVLVSIGLFWAVVEYSAEVGTKRAQLTAAKLRTQPDVVVYSAHSLSLQAPGVRELSCPKSDAAYRFRYDGLALVLQSGNQYFFLPKEWTPARGVAIVIPRSDSLRLEFTKASAARTNTSTICR